MSQPVFHETLVVKHHLYFRKCQISSPSTANTKVVILQSRLQGGQWDLSDVHPEHSCYTGAVKWYAQQPIPLPLSFPDERNGCWMQQAGGDLSKGTRWQRKEAAKPFLCMKTRNRLCNFFYGHCKNTQSLTFYFDPVGPTKTILRQVGCMDLSSLYSFSWQLDQPRTWISNSVIISTSFIPTECWQIKDAIKTLLS